MKIIAAATITAIAALLAIPLFAGGTTGRTSVACGDVPRILATIRALESGGDYTALAARASASGAYQIIDSTWRAWSAEADIGVDYPRAFLAPPEVQDAVAGFHVQRLLDQYHDMSLIPVAWYYPAAINRPELLDIVPAPQAGNTLTPRQYQTRWMDHYTTQRVDATVSCPPVTGGGEWALPVDQAILDANPTVLSWPHHDYPAWDLPVPDGTQIYAVHAGTVDRISTWNGNCASDRSRCGDMCGVGLTIQDTAGVRWIYCHGSRLDVAIGDVIVAGQPIMLSGNTGHSSGPHLHLGIRLTGVDYCPQRVVTAIYHGLTPPTPTGSRDCVAV